MAKILELDRSSPDPVRPYKCKVLVYGKEWEFAAESIQKIIVKIMERDRHMDKDDIVTDLQLNYSHFCV